MNSSFLNVAVQGSPLLRQDEVLRVYGFILWVGGEIFATQLSKTATNTGRMVCP